VTSTYDVEKLGQVFTPDAIVAKMVSLLENRKPGSLILEPSCGDGAFLRAVPEAIGVEYDARHASPGVLVGDFFAFAGKELKEGSFDAIIGNPPFVRFKDMDESTRALVPVDRFDKRTNLYVFFIDRCLDLLRDGGELVFINPRDFLKATHAGVLNKRLVAEGSFTYMEDLGDEPIFPGFAPNCVIMRWQKGKKYGTLPDGRVAVLEGSTITFKTPGGSYGPRLGDLFSVRVGGVSGMDEVFKANPGDPNAYPFACSKTRDTGEPRWMTWGDSLGSAPEALLDSKDRLLTRRARAFGEQNWWHWIRKPPPFLKDGAVLVNSKTRRENPFYAYKGAWVDGAVLALYPTSKASHLPIEEWARRLNKVDWEAIGFRSGGRFLFSQRALQECTLPQGFADK